MAGAARVQDGCRTGAGRLQDGWVERGTSGLRALSASHAIATDSQPLRLAGGLHGGCSDDGGEGGEAL
jgi:hypothetical protein